MPVMIREVVGLAAIVLALAGCASVLSGLDWNAALVVVEVSNGEREQITHTPHGYSGLTS